MALARAFIRRSPACLAIPLLISAWLSTPARAALWLPDQMHSKALFVIGHDNSLATVTGWFVVGFGTLEYDGKDVSKATVNVEMETKTLTTGCWPRDMHLQSDDFFDIKKYPKITFVSKEIKPQGPGKFKMTGDLTIKDVTRSVTLDCVGPKGPITEKKRAKIGVSATTKIKPKDFHITWNREVDKGVQMVGDEADIRLELEFAKIK